MISNLNNVLSDGYPERDQRTYVFVKPDKSWFPYKPNGKLEASRE